MSNMDDKMQAVNEAVKELKSHARKTSKKEEADKPIMYKITLSDKKSRVVAGKDSTFSFFVEDLSEFEKRWLPRACYDTERINRYYKSKFGDIITDNGEDKTELNIVQSNTYEVVSTKDFEYHNKKVRLLNGNLNEVILKFKTLKVSLMVIKYGKEYKLVGKYFGLGCFKIEEYNGRKFKTDMGFFGNPIAAYICREFDWEFMEKSKKYAKFYHKQKNLYDCDTIAAFVWLPLQDVKRDYKINELNDYELAYLLRDIVD